MPRYGERTSRWLCEAFEPVARVGPADLESLKNLANQEPARTNLGDMLGVPPESAYDTLTKLSFRSPAERLRLGPRYARLFAAAYHMAGSLKEMPGVMQAIAARIAGICARDDDTSTPALVVDVGAGTGSFLEALRSCPTELLAVQPLTYLAIDVDEERLALLRAVHADLGRKNLELTTVRCSLLCPRAPLDLRTRFSRVFLLAINSLREVDNDLEAGAWFDALDGWSRVFDGARGTVVAWAHTAVSRSGAPVRVAERVGEYADDLEARRGPGYEIDGSLSGTRCPRMPASRPGAAHFAPPRCRGTGLGSVRLLSRRT